MDWLLILSAWFFGMAAGYAIGSFIMHGMLTGEGRVAPGAEVNLVISAFSFIVVCYLRFA